MSGKRKAKTGHPRQADLEQLLAELTAIRMEMIDEADTSQAILDNINPLYRISARNLLHYLVLRRHDLRPLQTRLAELGLSSLGRAESHVLALIDAVLDTLHRLTGTIPPRTAEEPVGFSQGTELLVDHTNCQLGPPPPDRWVRIMVTMPSAAAEDYGLIHTLLQHGMDCMRINCAHDDEAAWLKMIGHLRRAEKAMGRSCRVVMDLGGPKLRTGRIEAGQAVIRIRPQRDRYGRLVEPARVWLSPRSASCPPPVPAAACLAVPDAWLARLRRGHHIHFIDARESRRVMTVVETTGHGCLAELEKTAYIVAATVLRTKAGKSGDAWYKASVDDLPPGERAIHLQKGDLLIVTRSADEGHPAVHDASGNVVTPATIGSTIPEAFTDVRQENPSGSMTANSAASSNGPPGTISLSASPMPARAAINCGPTRGSTSLKAGLPSRPLPPRISTISASSPVMPMWLNCPLPTPPGMSKSCSSTWRRSAGGSRQWSSRSRPGAALKTCPTCC